MALITCLKCGGTYSDKTKKCPHCNYEPQFFVCPECNQIYYKDEETCSACGVSFADVAKIPATDEKITEAFNKLVDSVSGVKTSGEYFAILNRMKNFEGEENFAPVYRKLEEDAIILESEEAREESYRISKENFCKSDDIFVRVDAYNYLKTIQDYKDVTEILESGKEEFEQEVYGKAQEILNGASEDEDFDKASQLFEYISDYNDSLELKNECIARKTAKNKKKKRRKNVIIGLVVAGAVAVIASVAGYNYMNPKEAREVRDKITALSESEITADSEAELTEIQKAYDQLDERGKNAVKNYADLEAAYKKYYTAAAEDYDSKAQVYVDSGENADLNSVKSLYDEYNSLDEEVKAQVTTYDKLTSVLCDVVTANICAYDVNNISEMKSLYNTYKEFLLQNDRLTEAALHMGQHMVYDCMEQSLQNQLKNPYSLVVSTYTLNDPVASVDEENCYSVTGSMNYSATNSFGAYVSDTAYGTGDFTIDLTDGSIDAHGSAYSF